MSKITIYSQSTVKTTLVAYGMTKLITRGLYLLDANYVAVSDKDASDYFFKLSKQAASALVGYEETFRDCDKFSRLVQSLGIVTHAISWKQMNVPQTAGLGLGVFNYQPDSGNGLHSINFLLTKKESDSSLHIRFFEPQTGNELFLTITEKNSVDLVLL